LDRWVVLCGFSEILRELLQVNSEKEIRLKNSTGENAENEKKGSKNFPFKKFALLFGKLYRGPEIIVLSVTTKTSIPHILNY
jgi:hypothetical protein